MWVCTSTPPGSTYLPVASIVRTGAMPIASAWPGASTAAMVSPSMRTSPALRPVALRMSPPVISVVLISGLDELAVGIGPTVAVEGPTVADLFDLVEVQIPHDQFGLVGVTRVADELALGIDEIALAVEVVVADFGLDA